MNKISFISTGLLPNTKSIDFACYLAARTQAQLTGLFLEEDILELVPLEPKHSYFEDVKESRPIGDIVMDIDQSLRYFVQECKKKGMRSDVRHHLGNPVNDAVNESRYADLLLIGAEEVSDTTCNQTPTSFIKQVLSKAECPVIIAPAYFEDIDTIVFCYDGSRSSVFAMKQFTYLLPQYADKNVIVLEIERKKTSITEKANVAKWLSAHFSKVDFEVLEGNTEDELFKYFFMKVNTFIIMGAYGRDMLSSIFHHSEANVIMKSIDLPLFIAHH